MSKADSEGQPQAAQKAGYQPQTNAEEQHLSQSVQSQLEYWKAQYDFQKHLMSTGLAGVVGFAALLVGVLESNEPGVWPIAEFLFGKAGLSFGVSEQIAVGMIALAFGSFVSSVVTANRTAGAARSVIGDIGKIRQVADIPGYSGKRVTSFERWNICANVALVLGILLVLLFTGGNIWLSHMGYGG